MLEIIQDVRSAQRVLLANFWCWWSFFTFGGGRKEKRREGGRGEEKKREEIDSNYSWFQLSCTRKQFYYPVNPEMYALEVGAFAMWLFSFAFMIPARFAWFPVPSVFIFAMLTTSSPIAMVQGNICRTSRLSLVNRHIEKWRRWNCNKISGNIESIRPNTTRVICCMNNDIEIRARVDCWINNRKCILFNLIKRTKTEYNFTSIAVIAVARYSISRVESNLFFSDGCSNVYFCNSWCLIDQVNLYSLGHCIFVAYW